MPSWWTSPSSSASHHQYLSPSGFFSPQMPRIVQDEIPPRFKIETCFSSLSGLFWGLLTSEDLGYFSQWEIKRELWWSKCGECSGRRIPRGLPLTDRDWLVWGYLDWQGSNLLHGSVPGGICCTAGLNEWICWNLGTAMQPNGKLDPWYLPTLNNHVTCSSRTVKSELCKMHLVRFGL